MARRSQINILATQAAELCNKAKRIPVLADTTLIRGYQNSSAGQPARTDVAGQTVRRPPEWRLLVCLNQMWTTKTGQAFPSFAPKVLDFLGHSMHHPHQISLAQFCAHNLRQVLFNLDMLAIARTTKLTATCKEQVEEESTEEAKALAPAIETEFHGGEQVEEPEDEDIATGSWRPEVVFSHDQLTSILSRQSEVAAAKKKGRKSLSFVQMKVFDECFHSVLNKPVEASTAKPQQAQLTYAHRQSFESAMLHQDAIVKEMRSAQSGAEPQVDPNTEIGRAVLHNLQSRNRAAEWIDLPAALQGPAHVAKLLIKKLQDNRSTPEKPYRLNQEQLECTALFVHALDKAFAKRKQLETPYLDPAEVILTIITDGGGGCGKTTLAVEVILPLLETYYRPEGVLRRAPSNKPARLIGGRTMHSGQGLTPENSMRTAALALNAQSQHKLAVTHADAGALYIDEASQLQAELNHAASLRTTYARQSKYRLNPSKYAEPSERFGRLGVLWSKRGFLVC